jgi:hypothetical protein
MPFHGEVMLADHAHQGVLDVLPRCRRKRSAQLSSGMPVHPALPGLTGTALCVLSAWNRAEAQMVAPGQVPAVVQSAYAAKFPGKRKTEWKLKSDRKYEAEFELRGVGVAAKFDSTGAWLETESDISARQIPAVVLRAIARDFSGYRIIERQVLVPRNGPTLFEIHLQDATETLKTQFDSTGALVMRSAKPR